MAKKKLVVIDGKSVFYRGYYAMPNLATRDGTPTGGVYGFAMLALQILKKLEPDYVIVAWDKSKTNIRSRRKLYADYKANRKPMPDDMREQIPVLRQLLEGFNWPLLECDDYEADDIMATLTRLANKKGLYTTLVTSDLDILQAIDGTSDVFLLKRGLTNVVRMDRKAFEAEYGMSVEQFIDYKALKGDSSDNVPGVAGVGDKTAKDLIKQFDTLEGIYQNLEKIPEKLRAKLETSKDMAFLSHKLLEIQFNAPVKLDLTHADVAKANPEEIAQLFEKLEFRRLIAELPRHMKSNPDALVGAPTSTKGGSSGMKAQAELGLSAMALPAVTSKASINRVEIEHLDSLAELLELDGKTVVIHAVGPNRSLIPQTEVSGWLISTGPDNATYIDTANAKLNAAEVGKKLATIFSKLKGVVGHDIKADYHAAYQFGVTLPSPVHDVMVAAFLLNALIRVQSLAELAHSELGADLDGLTLENIEQVGPLVTTAIWRLYEKQKTELKKLPKLDKLAKEIEWPIIPVLADMENTGVELDVQHLEQMSKELTKRIEEIQSLIYLEAKEEFNIGSPVQLQNILFNTLGLPTNGIKKTQGGYSTAATELDKLRGLHPIINLITEYRELTKLKNTYVDTLPKQVDEHSRLHTSYNITMAQTGRLSSENPNLQNIPIRTEVGKEIRKAFVAGKGKVLISADYSQFELRLAAVLSGDKNMIHAFNKGIDIHAMTAAEVYDLDDIEMVTKDQRRDAKVVNFGVLYGMSPHGLSVATGMNRDQAIRFIDRYFKLRKPLLNYMESIKEKARKDGYAETMFGRRRPMPDIKSSNFMVRSAAERAAINMPLQGTAADIMKIAMIQVAGKLEADCKQLLQIHDSILVECPKGKSERVAKLLKEIMENVYKLPVKLDVDVNIGNNWGEL